MDVEQVIELFKFAPRELDCLLPNSQVLRISSLKFNEFLAGLALDVLIGFLNAVDLSVEADQLGDGIAFERFLIEEMLPPVDDFAKLGSPVADVVVGDDLVAKKSGNAGQSVSENRAADVADMHRLGNVRRAEIQDDLSRRHGRDNSDPLVFCQRAER